MSVELKSLQVLYLTEKVAFLLSFGETRKLAVDQQVGVVQHSIEPTPCRKERLDRQVHVRSH